MQQPLAEQLRPHNFHDCYGQDTILNSTGWIHFTIQSGRPLSVLFWGPPGCGKTTIARLYMKSFSAQAVHFHPATHGIADLKKLLKDREDHPLLASKPLILFVDEIHRWNKAQQDTFLPYLENGVIILIGATTENPSFVLNSALLSRMRVLTFTHLQEQDLAKILVRALSHHPNLSLSEEVQAFLIQNASGDGRYLLNMVETLLTAPAGEPITLPMLEHLLQKKAPIYDRRQEIHHNLISALHKSVRGSDPDAALYWLSRMLQGGEDPKFLARRIVRMASEDVGLADPNALQVTLNAWESFERLGSPEGELALAQAVVYLSLSPKSNALYTAYTEAASSARQTSHLPPPTMLRNAPTKLSQDLGHGKGYVYDHDTPHGFSGQEYFPNQMTRKTFYTPVERGYEREMKKRLDYFSLLRKKLSQE
ncbi:MAG: replication-associated recombination protein A [Chlamydiae bacterium]|nr:replication-associated recombination protein A [Chlamydiota bacterium]